MNEVLKVSTLKKVHNSISHENHEFCLIFIKIIAYVHRKKNNLALKNY